MKCVQIKRKCWSRVLLLRDRIIRYLISLQFFYVQWKIISRPLFALIWNYFDWMLIESDLERVNG